MSYSIQLYTLRNALQEDLPGTIEKVAQLGFTQVEPYNFVATAAELGAALKENGLTAPSGHAPLLSQDQDEIFAAAKELGISTVIDPYLPAEHWQSAEDIQATAAKLNAAAKKGAGYGIRVGYHNHAWELESSIEGQTALEYFAGLLDPELVLEVDTYWAAVGGQDPVAASAAPRRPGEVHPHQGRPRLHGHQGPAAGRAGQDGRVGRDRRGDVAGSGRRGV